MTALPAVRVVALQDAMRRHSLELLLIAPSADMFHLIGRKLPLTERFNAVMVPRVGRPSIVVPRLQVPLVEPLAETFEIAIWEENEDPLTLVARYAETIRAHAVAVNNHLWSGFLLKLQSLMPSVAFSDASVVTSAMRLLKDEREIAALTDAGRRFDDIWAEFFAHGRLIGVTERDVVQQIDSLVRAQGFEALSWCDVGSGPNGASPLHHHSDRVILAGDPVVIDFAATRDGYYMDTCRTPVAGDPDPKFVRIYDVVNVAHEAAQAAVRPGVAAESVDRAARDVIEAAGYGQMFLHRLGHGLGIDAHEEPYIVRGNSLPLAPGMVFSNEPGIYIPGQWGVRIENIMVVTDHGARSLNAVTRDLVSMN